MHSSFMNLSYGKTAVGIVKVADNNRWLILVFFSFIISTSLLATISYNVYAQTGSSSGSGTAGTTLHGDSTLSLVPVSKAVNSHTCQLTGSKGWICRTTTAHVQLPNSPSNAASATTLTQTFPNDDTLSLVPISKAVNSKTCQLTGSKGWICRTTTTYVQLPRSASYTAPQNLQAYGGNGRVTLSWHAPSSNGGSAITYYKIFKSTSSGTEVYLTTRGNVTSYTDLGVTNGITYFYQVTALNSLGESPRSNEASARTATTTSTLTVTTQDTKGNAITGLYIELSQGGTIIATGYSPVNFTLNNGIQYSIAPDPGFGSYTFDHWLDTGSTVNPRSISINANTQITAVYRTATISLNPTSGPTGTTINIS